MGSSSFLNAFRLLKKKPMLLLLLLPLQLALPLVNILMPMPDFVSDITGSTQAIMNSLMGIYSYVFSIYAIILLLYLLAGIFLIPPAMELLHDGAKGAETPSGWYGRGFKQHWWKPVTFGAMETVLMFILGIIFYMILVVVMLMAMPGMMGSSLRYQDGGLPTVISMLAAILIPVLFFVLIYLLIYSFFAMLLPATADRGFGAAFKVLFSGYGFKKVMKVFGVYILTTVLSVGIYLLVLLGYGIVSSMTAYPEVIGDAMGTFASSWIFYGVSAVVSLITLFKYAYIFCVFQEIKNREAGNTPPLLQNGGETEATETFE